MERSTDFAEVLREGEEQFGLPQEVLAVKFLKDVYERWKQDGSPKQGTTWTEMIYPFIKPLIQDFAKDLNDDDYKGGFSDELTSKISQN